jgi:hypothetical protein
MTSIDRNGMTKGILGNSDRERAWKRAELLWPGPYCAPYRCSRSTTSLASSLVGRLRLLENY